MSGPWEDFEQGPWADFTPAAPTRTTGQEVKRQLGLTARVIPEALGAIPLAVMDAGVGARNLLTGSNYESPSAMYAQGLDQIFPKRETGLEEAVGLASNAIVGSRIPVPTVKGQAPAGFTKPLPQQAQTLVQGQSAGYVVPPTTTNPTATNRMVEGVAGKLTTAQLAAVKNQGVTNKLAARALGLPEDMPISLDSIKAVRAEAGKAYDAVRAAGTITADDMYRADLRAMTARFRGAAKDFPELAKSDVDGIVEGLSKDSFDADSAVDLIAILRDKADDAFRAGNSQLGRAYKAGTSALERAIERDLGRRGKDGVAILKQYRDARQMMAKTYTVEKSLNTATGNVDPAKVGREFAKGKPLTDELRTVGQFQQAFPKASRSFNESMPGVSPLDFYASGGIAGVAQQPWYLLYPFARQTVRNGLLSRFGQKMAVPSGTAPPVNGLAGGAATSLVLLPQQ